MENFYYGIISLFISLILAIDLIRSYQKEGKIELTFGTVRMIGSSVGLFLLGCYFLFN